MSIASIVAPWWAKHVLAHVEEQATPRQLEESLRVGVAVTLLMIAGGSLAILSLILGYHRITGFLFITLFYELAVRMAMVKWAQEKREVPTKGWLTMGGAAAMAIFAPLTAPAPAGLVVSVVYLALAAMVYDWLELAVVVTAAAIIMSIAFITLHQGSIPEIILSTFGLVMVAAIVRSHRQVRSLERYETDQHVASMRKIAFEAAYMEKRALEQTRAAEEAGAVSGTRLMNMDEYRAWAQTPQDVIDSLRSLSDTASDRALRKAYAHAGLEAMVHDGAVYRIRFVGTKAVVQDITDEHNLRARVDTYDRLMTLSEDDRMTIGRSNLYEAQGQLTKAHAIRHDWIGTGNMDALLMFIPTAMWPEEDEIRAYMHQKLAATIQFDCVAAGTPAEVSVEGAVVDLSPAWDEWRDPVLELVKNAHQHAGTQHPVRVVFTTGATHTHVRVRDEGVGIDTLALAKPEGGRKGLMALLEAKGGGVQRVSDWAQGRGGVVVVQTVPLKGTEVAIKVPVT